MLDEEARKQADQATLHSKEINKEFRGAPYVEDSANTLPNGDRFPAEAQRILLPPPQRVKGRTPGVHASKEYVSGHKGVLYAQFLKALEPYIDDLTKELGDDLYERMRFDPQIESCLKVLAAAVLADDGKVQPNIVDEDAKDYPLSKEIADFCDRQLKYLETPLDVLGREMFTDGLAVGHKVAELIFNVHLDGEDEGKWYIERLHTKPRQNVAFLVDSVMKVRGMLCVIPGLPFPIVSGQLVQSPDLLPNLMPREKFFVYAYNPKNGDPRGRSALRCCYNPWWTKMQTWGVKLAWLSKYGDPPLVGTTAEGDQTVQPVDEAGNLTGEEGVSPEDALLSIMTALRNGSNVAKPPGTEIVPLEVNMATTNVHDSTIDLCDKQMAKGLMGQVMATEEGSHLNKATQQGGADLLQIQVRNLRREYQACVKRDVLKTLVKVNYGTAASMRYCPDYIISDMAQEDWAKWSSLVNQLFTSGYLTEDQKVFLDKKMGLPKAEKKGSKRDGSVPAITYVNQINGQMEMELKKQEMQLEAQAQQGAQQGAQGQPTGKASPAHPSNQPQ